MTLGESYAHCRRVARRRARNFYYSFLLLPAPKGDALCAIYAFMRECDDLSDEPGAQLAPIADWRTQMVQALSGQQPPHAVWPAFQDTVARYGIPHGYFHDMIDGVESDLEPRRIETFDELYRYCYRVASVVGMTIVHIFGFQDRRALELAEKCGIAFQLTNILRDVREDLDRGRVYLPAEDLRRFGVEAIEPSEPFRKLMEFESARARQYYNESAPLIGMVDASSRASLRAMIQIYSRLLTRIERSGYDVLSRRIRVPAWEKLAIMARGFVRG